MWNFVSVTKCSPRHLTQKLLRFFFVYLPEDIRFGQSMEYVYETLRQVSKGELQNFSSFLVWGLRKNFPMILIPASSF